MNIVIPMAGLGSRFSERGFALPKPLIDVNGVPMIRKVLENFSGVEGRFVLLVRREHFEKYQWMFDELSKDFDISYIIVESLTQGTAATVLLAEESIDNDVPTLIANSDQLVDIHFLDFLKDAVNRNLAGSILTFKEPSLDPKWSFARLDSSGFVCEVAEKVAISNIATVGIYYFSEGSDFVRYAKKMIDRKDMVNGEYYTCPVYNYMIEDGHRIGVFEIDRSLMHGLGTPEDLKIYLTKLRKS